MTPMSIIVQLISATETVMLSRVEDFSRCIAQTHGLHDPKINIKPGKNKGDGFLSDIHMVSATDEDGKEFHIIVKSATGEKIALEDYHVREAFENERLCYGEIFPKLEKFQEEEHVSRPFKAVAQYYGSCFDGNVRLIAFENLRNSGYVLFDKKGTFDGEHVEKVFTEYGKFHGVCFAFQREQKETFEELTDKLHPFWNLIIDGKSFGEMLNSICASVFSVLEDQDAELANRFEDHKEGFSTFKKTYASKMMYSTLTHGDCWSNNFMFKYEKNDEGSKKLDSVRILDWQAIRIGSPVFDLSYFFYSGASKKEFDDLDHYLEVYYKSLSRNVRELGHDPEDLYPFHVLKADWKTHSMLGFLLGLFMQRNKLTYDDSLVDFQDIEEAGEYEGAAKKFLSTKYDTELFKERVVNLVTHMVEIGVL